LPVRLHTPFDAVTGAVVVAISVETWAAEPLTVKVVGFRLHWGGSTGFTMDVVTVQLRFTIPVKPFVPTTLSVVVLPVVAPGSIEIELVPLPVPVNPGGGVTLRAICVDPDKVPDDPMMVTVAGEVVTGADAPAVNAAT